MVLKDLMDAAMGFLSHRGDDDFIDRLHYWLSTNLLISLAILTSFKQFGGKPVECMIPDMFPGSYEDYAENYCWAQDTYFLPFEDEVVSTDVEVRYQKKISYYQWVPFFLLFESLCFRIPSLLWRYMGGHSGIKVHDIVRLATDPKNVECEGKKDSIRSLTVHLQNALRFHRRLYKRRIQPHAILKPLNLPYTAFYVTFVYILVKVVYLLNVAFQLYMLNTFLQTDSYRFYGFGALIDLMRGHAWELSGVFPRVTLCDFKVRAMGSNVQDYTIQCVLVINIFNEKIFIFLWFWYLILMVLTGISIIYWFFVMGFRPMSRSFISRHLELSEMPFDPASSQKDVERFVSGYLKTDGVFILRMINMHAGIIFGTDLVLALWRAFYGIEETYRRHKSSELTPYTPPEDQNKENSLRLRRPGAPKFPMFASQPKEKDHLKEALLPDSQVHKALLLPATVQDKDESDQNQPNLSRQSSQQSPRQSPRPVPPRKPFVKNIVQSDANVHGAVLLPQQGEDGVAAKKLSLILESGAENLPWQPDPREFEDDDDFMTVGAAHSVGEAVTNSVEERHSQRTEV